MRVTTIITICAVLTAGAFYGRFLFLRDRGYLPKEINFLQYVLGEEVQKEKPPSRKAVPGARKGKSSPPPPASAQKAPSKSKKPASAPASEARPEPLEQSSGARTAQALEAWRNGKIELALRILAGLKDPEAETLRRKIEFFGALVRDVKVDPGAGARRIFVVKLANGNVLYAVEATKTGSLWKLRLANGIGCGLNADMIQSVTEQDASSFHKQRAEELAARLKQLKDRGGFGLWKAIRLAWRRGFPQEAYKYFEQLTGNEQLLAGLQAVLPQEKRFGELLLAQADLKGTDRKTTIPEPSRAAAAEPPKQPEKSIAADVGRTAGEAAFRKIDEAVRKAQAKIYQALNREGKEADLLLREAGRLLVQARNELLNSPDLPRGKPYQERLRRVTLILDDFLKLSSFGLSR